MTVKGYRNYMTAMLRAEAADALNTAANLTLLAAVSARRAAKGGYDNRGYYYSIIRNNLNAARCARLDAAMRGFALSA